MSMNRSISAPGGQRGLAAVLAILVVALAASTAIYLVWEETVALRQVENLDARAQIREIARAGTSWAAAILSQDDPKADYLDEPWAQPLPPIDVEQATLEGGIIDEQSKFNLNTVWSPTGVTSGTNQGSAQGATQGSTQGTAQGSTQNTGTQGSAQGSTSGSTPMSCTTQNNLAGQAFRILLGQLGLNPSLCDALVDWIDPDSNALPDGAEDPYYLSQDPPYRAGNSYLVSVGELRLIKGFTPEVVDRLSPYVTALQPSMANTLNINTASPDMLHYFMPDVNVGAIIEYRKRTHFTGTQDFQKLVSDDAYKRLNGLIGVNSNFFSARARVTQGRTSITYRAILQRQGGATAGAWPTVISITEEPM